MATSNNSGGAGPEFVTGLAQDTRPFRVKTALPATELVLRSMRITEALSSPFDMDVELLSGNPSIDYDAVLGHNLTIGVSRPKGEERFFNGYVTSFGFVGMRGRQYAYRASVSPWFWLLKQTENCRIFHGKTAIEIAEKIFGDHGFTEFEVAAGVSPPAYPYCVQYRESDFNFISRLFEKEGIYYYFKHENGKHILVITNSMSSHVTDGGYETLPIVRDDQTALRLREGVFNWRNRQQLRATEVTLQDYNHTAPRAEMNATETVTRNHAAAGLKMYQYPGEYATQGEGVTYAKLRVEEQQAVFDLAQAETNARGVRTGYKFTLENHTNDAMNTDYLVVSTHTELHSGDYSSGDDSDSFSCSLTVMPLTGTYRPPRVSRKTLIHGPQTAVVNNAEKNKPLKEILPRDEFGCVTVSFEWERENILSCPIRVSQAWAGTNWGSMMIPRHGQEVIVEFENGDPDRPLITGRVYNGKQLPAYNPKDRPTVTAFKTNSSEGGGGYNELRFDDLKGEENIFIHAEHTMDVRIKDTKLQYIGKDHHEIVEENQYLEIKGEKHETIGADLKLEVKDNINVVTTSGSAYYKASSDTVITSGGAVHLDAGSKAVIEGSRGVHLKCGGSFINITSSGIEISGSSVKINSGGSPGSGPGDGAESPTAPDEAQDDKAGSKEEPRGRTVTPTKTQLDSHKVAVSLLAAAGTGAPFCEVCARNAAGGGG